MKLNCLGIELELDSYIWLIASGIRKQTDFPPSNGLKLGHSYYVETASRVIKKYTWVQIGGVITSRSFWDKCHSNYGKSV